MLAVIAMLPHAVERLAVAVVVAVVVVAVVVAVVERAAAVLPIVA